MAWPLEYRSDLDGAEQSSAFNLKIENNGLATANVHGYNNGVVCHFFSQLSDAVQNYHKVEWSLGIVCEKRTKKKQQQQQQPNKKCINKLWSLSYHGFELKVCIQLVQEAIFSSASLWLLFRWDGFCAKREKKRATIHLMLGCERAHAHALSISRMQSMKQLFSSWFT